MLLEPAERRDAGNQIREQLRVLREGRWIVLLLTTCAVLGAVLYTTLAPPVYESQARLLLQDDDLGTSLVAGAGGGSVDPEREAATALELASLPALAKRVVADLRLGVSPGDLLEQVEVEAQGNSELLSITARDRSAVMAQRIAQSFASQYVAFRRDADRRRFTSALALVRSRISQVEPLGDSPQLDQLREQARQLELLASLQTGGAEVIQAAGRPSEPATPGLLRTAVLAGIVGLLLGVGLALLRDKLDRRVKKEEDVRRLLPGVPVLAQIPRMKPGAQPDGHFTEGFRTLATNLSFVTTMSGSLRSLLVTSAMTGEGKTTTSLNLARSLSDAGRDVTLIEADLRRPGLSELLGLRGQLGVSNVLSGHGDFGDFADRIVLSAHDGLDAGAGTAATVLPAGPMPPNPQILLSGERFGDLLQDALDRSDMVIFDGTPVGPFSDMLPIASRVDGVIVVVRLYHSTRDNVERMLEQLGNAGVRPIGVVLFGAEASADGYYYTAS